MEDLNYAVSVLARDHVRKYTLALDRFLAQLGQRDDVGSFLAWLQSERAWEWTWM